MYILNEHTVLPIFDYNGTIIESEEWTRIVAEGLSQRIGIKEMNKEHWQVIHRLRDYYDEFGVSPSMENLCYEFKQDKQWVHRLFGSALNAWCIAGLPDPGEEAKSYLFNM